MNSSPGCKKALPCLVVLAAAIALWIWGPIPQDPEYHHFADRRELFGIPNFRDVATNLPFLLVGLAGLAVMIRGKAPGIIPALRPAYFAFFAGTALVALGSGYYHWAPSNGTLIWDRLPMTIAFMSFFSIVIGEHLSERWGARLLLPLLLFGGFSVAYWGWTEAAGRGDLRFYVFAQFVPMLLIPVILLCFPSRLSGVWQFWALIGAYAVAKGLELTDAPVFDVLGSMSGHSLKHLTAGIGTFFVLLAVTRRVASGSRDVLTKGLQAGF